VTALGHVRARHAVHAAELLICQRAEKTRHVTIV
jgi:hypothetical protein